MRIIILRLTSSSGTLTVRPMVPAGPPVTSRYMVMPGGVMPQEPFGLAVRSLVLAMVKLLPSVACAIAPGSDCTWRWTSRWSPGDSRRKCCTASCPSGSGAGCVGRWPSHTARCAGAGAACGIAGSRRPGSPVRSACARMRRSLLDRPFSRDGGDPAPADPELPALSTGPGGLAFHDFDQPLAVAPGGSGEGAEREVRPARLFGVNPVFLLAVMGSGHYPITSHSPVPGL